MKNLKLLLFGMVFLLAVSLTYALPEISYTNFARTAGGGLVLSGNVDVRITILEGSSQLYQETHAGIATNEFGLFTVKLGEGTPVGPDTYNGLLAKSTLNIKAESNDGGGYRFIELSALLSTALKNEEAAAAVSLNDAYITGNEIEVVAGFPVDLKGTGLIQSAASVADINANGDATLTTKKYVDDAVAAILPLDPLTVNEGLQMTPGPSYDGTAAQVVGIAPKAITNAKIADATEFLAVAALGDGGVAGADAGTVSLTNLTHTLNFQGVGETNVTRTGNTILIDGADNWGSQVVETDATLVGDGTTLNKLGINVDNSNAWNADQLLPATLAQGNNLIAAIEAGTPYSMDIDVLATGAAGQVFNSTGAANQWSNLNDAVASDIDFFANTDVTALDLQIKDGTVGNTEINDATVFVEVTGNGTPFDVTDGNPVLNFTGNSITSVTLDDATNTVHIESAVATQAPITGDGTLSNAIGLDFDATLELNAGKLGIDLDHKNTWTVTQSFVPAANEPGIVLNGGTNNSAVLVANGFGYFENTKTTSAAFAVQGSAYGQTPNLGDLPVVAQGLTGVSAYTGAAPTTNMAIGTVGLGVSGNGAIAIGVYGGSRNINPVANVGTVGHALNDNLGNDVNHGILGLISTATVPQDEITYLMTTPLNSAITGINLGVNANDFAGYFHGKVKSTGTIEGTLLIGALDKKIEEGAGIANFMFNNSADAIVALDYNYANEWFVTQTFSDIIVNNNTMTGSLDVDTDAMVGGDVTAGGMFIGALEHNITNGDGVASFTFDNTGDAVVAFDYGFENHWTANQTFDEVTILGGTIDGAIIGSIEAEEGTFTDLEYTGTFTTPLDPMGVAFIGAAGELTVDAANFYLNGTDLNLAGTMYIGTDLDVLIDATIGGNLDVTGNVTGNDITANGMFIGALEHNITNGDGVASFTFDNTGDAVVAFDYGFENHWTANQTFDEVTILGGTIDGALIGSIDAEEGTFTNLEYTGTFTTPLTPMGVPFIGVAGELTEDAANFYYNASDLNLAGTMYIGTNLDVMVDATVGGDLDVTGDITGNDITAGGMFIGALEHNITNGDGVASFTFDNTGDAVVAFDYGFENHWTANQTFDEVTILSGAIDNTVIGANTPDAGTFTNLEGDDLLVNNDAAISGSLSVGILTETDYLDVLSDATVGGNLGVGGDVTATTFIGALENPLTNGPGIVTFSYNNSTAGIQVEVDYDATLEITGNQLGIDLDHENSWTVNQEFALVDINGGTIDGTTIGATVPANGTFTNVTVKDGAGNTNFVIGASTTEDAGWAKLFTDAGNEIVILGTTGVNGSRAGAVSVTDVNGWGPGVPIYGAGMYNDPISGNWIVGAGQLDLSIGAAIFSDATGTASFSIMNSGVVFNADQDGDVMLTNDLTVGNDASVGNDLSVEGNTILGTNATNTVVFNGLVDSDIIPDENNVHSLGTDALRWMDVYVGPASLHVGESGNEGIIGFNTGLSQFTFDQNVEIDADLFVNNNIYGTEIYGTVFNGGFTVPGAILFADASGNIVEDTDGDFYFDNSNPLFEVLYVPNLSTTELNATGNVIFDQDLVVAGSVTINDYTLPLADGAAGQLVTTDGAGNLGWTGVIDAINGATGNATFDGLTGTTQTPLAIHDDLNGDLFITKNYLEDYLFNADELSFSGLVLFNAGSGPAIEATSSDATSPTVTIENTNSQGVALELVGAAPQTTALEISTGGLNIANGQLIVSSNSGVGGGDPNGPTITVNNNGDGVDENGGAIQIVMGHTAFSFNKYTPAANAAVNLAKEPYTVYEIVSNGGSGNSITLPNGDVAADNLGTIIYIINSGASTLTLPGGLGTVAAGQSAKLVQISTGWFRLN